MTPSSADFQHCFNRRHLVVVFDTRSFFFFFNLVFGETLEWRRINIDNSIDDRAVYMVLCMHTRYRNTVIIGERKCITGDVTDC